MPDAAPRVDVWMQHGAVKSKTEMQKERDVRLEMEVSLATATEEVATSRQRTQQLEQAVKDKAAENADLSRKLSEAELILHSKDDRSSESEVNIAKMEAVLKTR